MIATNSVREDIAAIIRVISLFQQYKMHGIPAMLRLLEYRLNIACYHFTITNDFWPDIKHLFLTLAGNQTIKFADVKHDSKNLHHVEIDFETWVPAKERELFRIELNLNATEEELALQRSAIQKQD